MNRRIRKKKEIKLLTEWNYECVKILPCFKKNTYKMAMSMARSQWKIIKKKNLNVLKVLKGEYTATELYRGINKEK